MHCTFARPHTSTLLACRLISNKNGYIKSSILNSTAPNKAEARTERSLLPLRYRVTIGADFKFIGDNNAGNKLPTGTYRWDRTADAPRHDPKPLVSDCESQLLIFQQSIHDDFNLFELGERVLRADRE